MSKRRNISWLFSANISQWQKNLQTAEKDLMRFSRNVQGIGRTLSTNITAPLAVVGGSLLAATMKAANYADEIDKTAQRTGLAREQLQELRFVADQTGVSFQSIQTAVTAFTRQLPQIQEGTGQAANAIRTLGVRATDSNGELRSMTELFPDVMQGLRGVTNETERNAIALQIFGRGASELIPMLNLSAQEFDNLTNRAHELGLVMGDESITELVAFNDAMAEVKMQAEAAGREFGMVLLPLIRDELIPFLQDTAIPALRGLAERFQNLDDATKKNIITYGIYAAAAGPVLLTFGKMMTTIPALINLFRTLTGVMLLNPWGLAITGVTALTAAVVVANRNLEETNKRVKALKDEVEQFRTGEISLVGDMTELNALSQRMTDISDEITRITNQMSAGGRGAVNPQLIQSMQARINKLNEEKESVRELLLESTKLIAERRNEETLLARLAKAEEELANRKYELAIENRKLIQGYRELQSLVDVMADDSLDNLANSYTAVSDAADFLNRANSGVAISLREVNDMIRLLNVALQDTFDEDNRENILLMLQALQQMATAMATLEANTDELGATLETLDIDTLTSAMQEFASITDQAFQALIFRGNSFKQILQDILKLLASRALTALIFGGITGGAGGGIFGHLFSGMFGGKGDVTNVNDALIKSDGSVVKFHPDDNILAMKDFSKLPTGGGGDRTIRVHLSGDFTANGSELRKAINESIYINE